MLMCLSVYVSQCVCIVGLCVYICVPVFVCHCALLVCLDVSVCLRISIIHCRSVFVCMFESVCPCIACLSGCVHYLCACPWVRLYVVCMSVYLSNDIAHMYAQKGPTHTQMLVVLHQ